MEKLGVEIGKKIHSFKVLDVWMDKHISSGATCKFAKLECLCGGIVYRRWSNVNSGRTKTCGCKNGLNLTRKPSGVIKKMVVGQEYWYFKIDKIYTKRVSSKGVPERTKTYCDVTCKCGNKRTHIANAIYNGRVRSCGCARRELQDLTIFKRVGISKLVGRTGIKKDVNIIGKEKMSRLLAANDLWVKPNMKESEFMLMKTEMFRNTYEFLK